MDDEIICANCAYYPLYCNGDSPDNWCEDWTDEITDDADERY